MFSGANSINLDSKGRISVPAKYRGSIIDCAQSHMIITCDPYDNCLLIFTLGHWKETEKTLKGLSNSKPLNRRIKRVMQAPATDVDMDASGRLLIPGVLRERAGLTKEVMLVGLGDVFQLWDGTQWAAQAKEDLAVLSSDELDSSELPDLCY